MHQEIALTYNNTLSHTEGCGYVHTCLSVPELDVAVVATTEKPGPIFAEVNGSYGFAVTEIGPQASAFIVHFPQLHRQTHGKCITIIIS